MLHRLLIVCGDELANLKGDTKIDECYLDGKEANKHKVKQSKAGGGAVSK